MLGTVDHRSLPLVSYAPFVRGASGGFFVYLSRLSEHTGVLIANPVASVLLIEDESGSREMFARTRISYLCDAAVIERTDPGHERVLEQFSQRFGRVIELLRSLPDFVLFDLTPRSGRFVMGFGQAYDLAGERLDRLVHVGPDQIKRG